MTQSIPSQHHRGHGHGAELFWIQGRFLLILPCSYSWGLGCFLFVCLFLFWGGCLGFPFSKSRLQEKSLWKKLKIKKKKKSNRYSKALSTQDPSLCCSEITEHIWQSSCPVRIPLAWLAACGPRPFLFQPSTSLCATNRALVVGITCKPVTIWVILASSLSSTEVMETMKEPSGIFP